jgi:apolipoprotein N-acyltransferase
LRRLGPALLALVSGYLHACSVAAPWDGQPHWWLQIVALAVLVGLVQRTSSVKSAALLGWLFATSWLAGSVWWLFTSMHTFGGLAAPLAVLAVLALSGFMAIFYAMACAIYRHLCPLGNMHKAQAAIFFAACWLLAELVRDTWLTGFPWAAGGYAQVDGPLAHTATHIGVYGVGVLASLLAWLCAWVWADKKIKLAIGSAVLLLIVYGASADWLQPDRYSSPALRSSVSLLQGNIPQGEKFEPSKGIPVALDWYAQQLQASTATLTIAPETAIPLLPRQLPGGYLASLQQRFGTGTQAALIGLPMGDFETGYTNSAMGLQPGQAAPYRYDKHHLVPFGEFIPPWFKWFTQMMNIPLGDFNRGDVGQPSFNHAGQRFAPNICYEDLFGNELAARFADEASAPTVLVNLSNIGWFGNSIAIDQHLHISRMRAIELGRPMLRATNTGPTVIIDHKGQVTHSLPRHTRGVLLGEVAGRSGTTPYAWWAARFGLWPLWGLGVAIILLAAYARSVRARGLKGL